jgi:glycosyltransferase involved in cell wall biosynthesis
VSGSGKPAAAAGRPLRIGVDVLSLRPGVNGGGETYMRGLVAGLAQVDPHNEYVVFATPRNRHLFPASRPGMRTVVCAVPGGRMEVWKRLAWEWLALRLQARRHRLDVMHFPGNLVPPAFPVPTVLTVHDFSTLFYHERIPEVKLPWSTHLMDRERILSCRRADWLVPNSDFTAAETRARTGVDPARIRTVPHIPREMAPPPLDEARRRVAEYGVTGRYVLSVATLNEHKNLRRLLEAFALEAGGALAGHALVLVGGSGWGTAQLGERVRALGLEGRVVLTGYVPDEAIPAFYRAADLYVFPSVYEGFGLPMLEAGACGTPVAAARAGALPEVGGDAAVYFDPYDPRDMAAALARVAGSEPLRRELAERGQARYRLFSAARTAREMVPVYRAAARGAGA